MCVCARARMCVPGLGATVVVLIIVISILYLYNGKRKTQKDLELHEMLLYDERQAREQVFCENCCQRGLQDGSILASTPQYCRVG